MIYYVDDNAKPTGKHEIHAEYCDRLKKVKSKTRLGVEISLTASEPFRSREGPKIRKSESPRESAFAFNALSRCRSTIEEAVRRKRGTEETYAREQQLLIIPLPFWEYKRTDSGISGETQERYIN